MEAPRNFRHAFALEYLARRGITVWAGNKLVNQILPSPVYPGITLPNPQFFTGQRFAQHGTIRNITSYKELMDLGIVIGAAKATKKFFSKQRVQHKLCRLAELQQHLGRMPPDCYVEHDVVNDAVLLVGPTAGTPPAYGGWMPVNREHSGGQPRTSLQVQDDHYRASLGLGERQVLCRIRVGDVPIMLLDTNEVLCYVDSPNKPSAFFVGRKRGGKSFAKNRWQSAMFWYLRWLMAEFNDSQRESVTWPYANTDPQQRLTLRMLNENPLPMPGFQFYPLIAGKPYPRTYHGTTGFDLTLSFKEILDHPDIYLGIGYGSLASFNKILPELRACRSKKEVLQVLERMVVESRRKKTREEREAPNAEYQTPSQSANKILGAFEMILESGLVDISSGQELWTVRFADGTVAGPYNPITACVAAGIYPAIVTDHIRGNQEMLSVYSQYFQQDIFERPLTDPFFRRRRPTINIGMDEVHIMAKSPLLEQVVREGGPRMIATSIATQSWDDMPDIIKGQTTHVFAFAGPEGPDIAKAYGLDREAGQIIKSLPRQKCLAHTSDVFAIYDSRGNRRLSEPRKYFVGKFLPPFCQHKNPDWEAAA